MKIKPLTPNIEQTPSKIQGVQIRATKHGLVAQKNGTVAPSRKSLLQRQFQTRFGFAGKMAASMAPMEAVTAIEMAKGTEQVPRDVASMASMGRYYVLYITEDYPARAITTPTTTDPDAVRSAALKCQDSALPWDALYLSIGNNRRLLL